MLYPLKRLADAIDGNTDNLIELTLLLQRSEEEMPVLRLILEHQNINHPNQHSRYLLACLNYFRGDTFVKDEALKELYNLADENYSLAHNLTYFMNSSYNENGEQHLPAGIVKAKNIPLVAVNIAETKNQEIAINELMNIYKKLDAKENRILRRIIMQRLVTNFEKLDMDLAGKLFSKVRNFLIDELRFAEYSIFIAASQTQLAGSRLFSKSELEDYCEFITELADSVRESGNKWNAKGLGNYSFVEIQEEIYNLESFLSRKEYYLNDQPASIESDTNFYQSVDEKFKNKYVAAHEQLTRSFNYAEKILEVLYQFSQSHGLSPEQKKAVEERERSARQSQLWTTDKHAEEIKNKEKMIDHLAGETVKISGLRDKESEKLFQTYNKLIDTVLKHFNMGADDSEIRATLNNLKGINNNFLTKDLNIAQVENLINTWKEVMQDCKQVNHPLYPFRDNLEMAANILEQELKREDLINISNLNTTLKNCVNVTYRRYMFPQRYQTTFGLFSFNRNSSDDVKWKSLSLNNTLTHKQELSLEDLAKGKELVNEILLNFTDIAPCKEKQEFEDILQAIKKIEYFHLVKEVDLLDTTASIANTMTNSP